MESRNQLLTLFHLEVLSPTNLCISNNDLAHSKFPWRLLSWKWIAFCVLILSLNQIIRFEHKAHATFILGYLAYSFVSTCVWSRATPSWMNPIRPRYLCWGTGGCSAPNPWPCTFQASILPLSYVNLCFVVVVVVVAAAAVVAVYYIPAKVSPPYPLPSSSPLHLPIHSSSTVPLQVQADLPWISTTHGLSSCSKTRPLLFY